MAPSATQSSQTNGDHEMTDATAVEENAPAVQSRGKYDFLDEKLRSFEDKIRVLPGDTPTAASFEIMYEDHTLGNALRWIIMKNPDVEFCGYSIPHPSDPKMNLRIQTYDESTSVYDALETGLNELISICDIVTDKFEEAQASTTVEKE